MKKSFHEVVTGSKKSSSLFHIFAGINTLYGQFQTYVYCTNVNLNKIEIGNIYAEPTRIDRAVKTEYDMLNKRLNAGFNIVQGYYVSEPRPFNINGYMGFEVDIEYKGKHETLKNYIYSVACNMFARKKLLPGEIQPDEKLPNPNRYPFWLKKY